MESFRFTQRAKQAFGSALSQKIWSDTRPPVSGQPVKLLAHFARGFGVRGGRHLKIKRGRPRHFACPPVRKTCKTQRKQGGREKQRVLYSSYLHKIKLIPMLLNNAGQVFSFKPHGGGVVVGWTPIRPGALKKSSSRKTFTSLFASFRIPNGVTDPAVRPKIRSSSLSGAKLSGRVWFAFRNAFKSARLFPFTVMR